MSEITVRRAGSKIVMMLISDDRRQVEVSLDAAEAATLGSLLVDLQTEVRSASGALERRDGLSMAASNRPIPAGQERRPNSAFTQQPKR
jgi:two-component sensor histidine kinase